jgi:hypothetical protein
MYSIMRRRREFISAIGGLLFRVGFDSRNPVRHAICEDRSILGEAVARPSGAIEQTHRLRSAA